MSVNELPKEYAVINWENLWRYVGRVVTGHHIPATTKDMITDLRTSARELRRSADSLERAANVMQDSKDSNP